MRGSRFAATTSSRFCCFYFLDVSGWSSSVPVLGSDMTKRARDFVAELKTLRSIGPANEEEKLRHCNMMLTNL